MRIPQYTLKLVREDNVEYNNDVQIRSSEDVARELKPYFDCLDREHVVVVLLDVKNRILGMNTVSIGHLSGAPTHPREVFKPAVVYNAYSIILAHNHPSGDPTPSEDDIAMTGRLQQAGSFLGIKLLDHVIMTGDAHYSMKEKGYL